MRHVALICTPTYSRTRTFTCLLFIFDRDRNAVASYKNFVIVLGAGASFGSKVGDVTPPLDAEFLKKARQLFGSSKGHSNEIEAWRTFRDALKRAKFEMKIAVQNRLEELSTFLEAKANMNYLQHHQGRPRDYRNALESLIKVICYTLLRCNGVKECSLHRALFELIEPRTIITFNYDLIADQTLLAMDKFNWTSPKYANAQTMLIDKVRRPVPRRRPHKQIRLLKLHGSINWHRNERGSRFSLVGDAVPDEWDLFFSAPSSTPLIVPPLAAKLEIQNSSLRALWSCALADLRDARGWLFWGYSFPETDTITRVLCRTALERQRKYKPVIVINPDQQVARRITSALGKIKVVQWPSVELFLLDHGRLAPVQGR